MESMQKQGILFVTVGRNPLLPSCLSEYFSEYPCYTASSDSVVEGLEQIAADGITKLVVQPLYIIGGIKYQTLCQELHLFQNWFSSIVPGTPLLTKRQDFEDTAFALTHAGSILSSEYTVLFIGHGSSHRSNNAYFELNRLLEKQTGGNIHLFTMRTPIQEICQSLRIQPDKRILLAPFFMTAGHHVFQDLAYGDQSLKKRLSESGYSVTCLLRGLEEYKEIQTLFIKKIQTLLT